MPSVAPRELEAAAQPDPTGVRLDATGYGPWPNAHLVASTVAEVVVVPEIGRVMQFRLAGDHDGPLWDNAALAVAEGSAVWRNYGGDKAWPAPQAKWEEQTGSSWPPPRGFDGAGCVARRDGASLVLESPTDADFGISVERRITLEAASARLTITTRYRKHEGSPVEVAVWVVTQVKAGLSSFMRADAARCGGPWCRQTLGRPSAAVERRGAIVGVGRDPAQNFKIEAAGHTLVWVGERHVLRVDALEAPGGEPAREATVQVYGNKDPVAYVELETQGAPRLLRIGEACELTNLYTLAPRSHPDAFAEAAAAFDWR